MLLPTTREDFLLPAYKIEVKDILPLWGAVPYYNNIIYVEKDTKKILVGVCSDIYGFVPTRDIFPKLEDLLDKNYEFNVIYKQQDYNKFYVDYIINDYDISFGRNNEIIKPMIKIIHSYNGQLKYTVLFGFYREICTNGLFGFIKKSEIDFKHTINNIDVIINDSINGIKYFIEKEIEQIRNKYEKLDQKECFYPEKVEKILGKLNFFPKKAIPQLEEILINENKKGVITNWVIYNAFNQILNNYNTKLYEEEILKVDNKIFEYLINN